MATIYRTYTLAEGITPSGVYERIDLKLKIQQYPEENKSKVTSSIELYGENTSSNTIDVEFQYRGSTYNGLAYFTMRRVDEYNGETLYTSWMREYCNPSTEATLEPGEVYKLTMGESSTYILYHNSAGNLRLEYNHSYTRIWDITNEEGTSLTKLLDPIIIDIPGYDKSIIPLTANNFTDEGNPAFSYSVNPVEYEVMEPYKWISTDKKTGEVDDEGFNFYFSSFTDTAKITSLQAALSLDGETIDVAYRDIPIDGTQYTFELTEEERELLRRKAQGSDTVPIYYLIKVVRDASFETDNRTYYLKRIFEPAELISKTQRTLTIVGCNPQLNPTVKDIKEETIALTGDENTFIRYESMAEYAINAVASKHATIVTQSVRCGSKEIVDLPYGVIDDVESGTFEFSVIDSRNMQAVGSVFKNLVEYVKPTCYQELEIALTDEVNAAIKVSVNGSYFNGSFGAADNELLLEVRHTDDNGTMGEWIPLTGTPTFSDNGYELETTFSGFNYGKAYTFQCRATDKLNNVQSSQYVIRLLPVFDWSETDFNFNVPININADSIDMHDKTIIRHNKEANNTVLSASGGHIYLRPKGTDNTSGETIIYPDGSVKFGGVVDLSNSFTIDGNTLADFIIETGEASMGSNGTWYWAKWASGKAECWGCRNFGNMAVTTAWGNLYRSAILTQDLPEDVFITTPDVITMNIVNSNFGGWLCKHENDAPSAITTGSFIFVRPASATISPTYIGFHVIGLWK